MNKHLLTLTIDEIKALNDHLAWYGTAGEPVLTRVCEKLEDATTDSNAVLMNTIKETLLHSLTSAIKFGCDDHYKTLLANAAEFVSDQQCRVKSSVENFGGGNYVLLIEVFYDNETYLLSYYDDDSISVFKSMSYSQYVSAVDDDIEIDCHDIINEFKTVEEVNDYTLADCYHYELLEKYFPLQACKQIASIVSDYERKYS